MSIRAAIYDLLNDTEADVYPFIAPQELAVPYVVYSMFRESTRTQSGIGVHDITLTLEIYADALADCISLADSLYSDLELASGTYATETLMVCNYMSESGNIISVNDGIKYNITQEYQLKFT